MFGEHFAEIIPKDHFSLHSGENAQFMKVYREHLTFLI